MTLIPKDEEIGLQLGTGIRASSIFLPFGSKNDEEKWNHPILKGKGRFRVKYFKPIQLLHQTDDHNLNQDSANSSDLPMLPTIIGGDGFWQRIWYNNDQLRFIRGVEIEDSTTYSEKDTSAVEKAFYIPQSIISNITKEELYTTSDDGAKRSIDKKRAPTLHRNKGFFLVDPIIGKQFVLAMMKTSVDTRLDKEPTAILITVKGETQCNLLIQPVETDSMRYLKANGTSLTINFNSRIKHIEIPDLEKGLGKDPNLFAVLTGTELNIVRFDRLDTSSISYTLFQPLKFSEFEQFAIADIAFNPWNLMEIAIIDTKGNWCIGRLEGHKRKPSLIKLLPYFSGSIFDPSELSLWSHIGWANDHKSLILLNRSKLLQLDYLSDWQQEVAEAKTWSEFRAYKRVDDQTAVLLSSKEIILLDTSGENVKKLLSWKHNWNPCDSSFGLNFNKICKDGKITLQIFLFSNFTPFLYEISLCYKGKSWIISSEPTLIKIPTDEPRIGISGIEFLQKNSNEFAEEEHSEEEHSEEELLCLVKFVNSEEILQGLISPCTNEELLASSQPKFEDKLRCASAERETSSIVSELTHTSQSDQKILQKYGYCLSERFNSVLEQWNRPEFGQFLKNGCLADFKIYPGGFENFSEYNSLLEQLINHYNSLGIDFVNVQILFPILLNEQHKNWTSFYNKMVKCWGELSIEPNEVTKTMLLDLSLELTAFQDSSSIYEVFDNTSNSLSNELGEVFSTWNDELDEHNLDLEPQRRGIFSMTPFPTQSSQIPMIRSSQLVGQNRMTATSPSYNPVSASELGFHHSRNSNLPGNITPAFSLGSQPASSQSIPKLSQMEGSQRHRRKKKKIGGFN